METSTLTTRSPVLEPAARGALWHRLGAACGLLFALGIFIGDDTINGAGEAPSPFDRQGDSVAEVNDYLANAADASASGSYWVGRGIGTLALIALLVFSLYVAREIRRQEKDHGPLSGLCFGAGLIAVALGLVSATAQFAVVARAEEGIDPEIARALLDFSGLTFVLMWLPLAVFLAATALAGTRFSLLPRWLAIAAGVLTVGLFGGLAAMPATNAGFFAIVLGFLWFMAASVALVRRAGVEREQGTAGGPAA